MQTGIVVEFGVECRGNLVTLTSGNDMAIYFGYRLAVGRQHLFDLRCTDKGHGHVVANAFDRASGMETAQLAPVGVAAHTDMHGAQIPL